MPAFFRRRLKDAKVVLDGPVLSSLSGPALPASPLSDCKNPLLRRASQPLEASSLVGDLKKQASSPNLRLLSRRPQTADGYNAKESFYGNSAYCSNINESTDDAARSEFCPTLNSKETKQSSPSAPKGRVRPATAVSGSQSSYIASLDSSPLKMCKPPKSNTYVSTLDVKAAPSEKTAMTPSAFSPKRRLPKLSLLTHERMSPCEKDVAAVARHLMPDPWGFEDDAFEERVDLVKGLISCYSEQAQSAPGAVAGRRPKEQKQQREVLEARELHDMVETRAVQIATQLLQESRIDYERLERVHLPVVFALARQQSSIDPSHQLFNLFDPDKPSTGSESRPAFYYPGLGTFHSLDAIARRQRPRLVKMPNTVPTLSPTQESIDWTANRPSLPPPKRSRYRPKTAPASDIPPTFALGSSETTLNLRNGSIPSSTSSQSDSFAADDFSPGATTPHPADDVSPDSAEEMAMSLPSSVSRLVLEQLTQQPSTLLMRRQQRQQLECSGLTKLCDADSFAAKQNSDTHAWMDVFSAASQTSNEGDRVLLTPRSQKTSGSSCEVAPESDSTTTSSASRSTWSSLL